MHYMLVINILCMIIEFLFIQYHYYIDSASSSNTTLQIIIGIIATVVVIVVLAIVSVLCVMWLVLSHRRAMVSLQKNTR